MRGLGAASRSKREAVDFFRVLARQADVVSHEFTFVPVQTVDQHGDIGVGDAQFAERERHAYRSEERAEPADSFFGGGFGGVLGMFLGVPVFACLQVLVKYLVDRRLRRRNMPTEAYCYVNRDRESQPPEQQS